MKAIMDRAVLSHGLSMSHPMLGTIRICTVFSMINNYFFVVSVTVPLSDSLIGSIFSTIVGIIAMRGAGTWANTGIIETSTSINLESLDMIVVRHVTQGDARKQTNGNPLARM